VDFLAGMKEGEVQCDGLLCVGEESQGKLFDAFLNSSDLQIEIKNGTNASSDDSTVKYTATVVCTNLEINADYDGVAEYSATFKIRGDFVKVK
jgi:predicted secreted protein